MKIYIYIYNVINKKSELKILNQKVVIDFDVLLDFDITIN